MFRTARTKDTGWTDLTYCTVHRPTGIVFQDRLRGVSLATLSLVFLVPSDRLAVGMRPRRILSIPEPRLHSLASDNWA